MWYREFGYWQGIPEAAEVPAPVARPPAAGAPAAAIPAIPAPAAPAAPAGPNAAPLDLFPQVHFLASYVNGHPSASICL